METRVSITSANDFFKLLRLTPQKDKLQLFAFYKSVLANLIKNSIDSLAAFWSQLDERLQKDIIENHESFLIAPFDSIQTFDYGRVKHQALINTFSSEIKAFNAAICSMFTEPNDVIKMIEKDKQLASKLFGWIPCSTVLLCHSNHFEYLLKHAPNTAIGVYLKAADDFFLNSDLEILFTLAKYFNYLPTSQTSSYSSERKIWFTNPDGLGFEVKPLLESKLKCFLGAPENSALLDLLQERDNFLRLNKLAFSDLLLTLPGVNLIKILFGEKITVNALMDLLKTHPSLAHHIVMKFSTDVASIFQDTMQYRVFFDALNNCEYYTTNRYYTEPFATAHTARLFANSADFSNWEWLARNSPELSWRTLDLAEMLIKKHTTAVRNSFSNIENIQKIIAINTAFLARVLGWLINDRSSNAKISLFANPQDFLTFLKNGGQHKDFDAFNSSLLQQYPDHVKFLYEHTDHFAQLEQKFISSCMQTWTARKKVLQLVETSGDITTAKKYPEILNDYEIIDNPGRLVALASTADQLFELLKHKAFESKNNDFTHNKTTEYLKSPNCRILDLLQSSEAPGAALCKLSVEYSAVFWLLLKHHPHKMLALLDYSSFMQLGTYERNPFIKSAPETVGGFFSSPNANLKDLMDTLNYFSFRLHDYRGYDQQFQQHFNKMFALYPGSFSNIFQSGTMDEKVEMVRYYPDLINLISAHNSQIIVRALNGAALVKLLQVDPICAQAFLEQFKDHISVLIPTREAFLALQQENDMLMRQFAARWPDKVPANHVIFGELLAPASLPSVVGNPSTLWHTPPAPTNEPRSSLLKELNGKPAYSSGSWFV